MSETLEEQIKRKTATSYKLMEVPNTISLEELNIIYNNKKKYYEGNARKLSSLDVAYDLIKKDRGFVSSAAAANAAASNAAAANAAASNAAAGSSAAASAAQAAALKEKMEHVIRLLLGESSPQSKQQEQRSNFYSAFRGTAKARSSATFGASTANKQENRQNQSSNKNKNKNKKEKEAFALFGTTKNDLEKLSVEEAKKKINKVFRIEALKYHPDKATGNEEEFKKWSTAKDLIDIIMGWETKNEKREGGTRKKRKN
jgi:hypothetical protein